MIGYGTGKLYVSPLVESLGAEGGAEKVVSNGRLPGNEGENFEGYPLVELLGADG